MLSPRFLAGENFREADCGPDHPPVAMPGDAKANLPGRDAKGRMAAAEVIKTTCCWRRRCTLRNTEQQVLRMRRDYDAAQGQEAKRDVLGAAARNGNLCFGASSAQFLIYGASYDKQKRAAEEDRDGFKRQHGRAGVTPVNFNAANYARVEAFVMLWTRQNPERRTRRVISDAGLDEGCGIRGRVAHLEHIKLLKAVRAVLNFAS